MTDNVHYLPNYEPPQEPSEPITVRVVIVPPPALHAPPVTVLGVIVAVLCGVVTFAVVSGLI